MSRTSPETVRAIDATVMAELTRQQEAGVKFLVGLNVDDLVAAIAATLPAGFAQCQQQWRPIETAPKNGTEIDLWCVNRSDGNEIRFPGMFWGEDDGWQDWHSYLLEMKWRPTHWMAQPAGPSDTSTLGNSK